MNDKPPFKPGDKVTINGYYHGHNDHLNHVVRTVLKVVPSRQPVSGWYVVVDGPNYQPRSTRGLSMDSGWFLRVRRGTTTKIDCSKAERIIKSIKEQTDQGKSDQIIDQSFQRHVTKVDLIACIRHLLLKGAEI